MKKKKVNKKEVAKETQMAPKQETETKQVNEKSVSAKQNNGEEEKKDTYKVLSITQMI